MLATGALNGICPYFTMFPLAFPFDALSYRGARGWVLDPFCGRGTTNYAARLLGLPSLGLDSNPMAVAVARAKLVAADPGEVVMAAREILAEVRQARSVPSGDFWDLAYHPEVLEVLCRLREGLMAGCGSAARTALRAVLLGALHGPQPKSGHSYLSNQSPRTYAPKPRYAVGFWKDRRLAPPRVDVLDLVRARAERYYRNESRDAVGLVVQGDARNGETIERLAAGRAVSWVICSPPYYGLRTYLPDQWLRLWVLGGQPAPDYQRAADQLQHRSPRAFVEQLRLVWVNVARVCAGDARLVIRFGGINDRGADPLTLIRASLGETPWHLDGIIPAGTASKGRRQARHFGGSSNPPIEEFDLWASVRP